LSELRRRKAIPPSATLWRALASEDLFVSVISIGEIAKGISLLRESPRKRALQTWLQTLEGYYADRLLPSISKPAASGENSLLPHRKRGGLFPPATASSLPPRGATVCT